MIQTKTVDADAAQSIKAQRRFFAKTRPSGECLEWTAARNPKGYGWFKLAGRMLLAHRVAWTISHGNIPGHLLVLHTCHNPWCVRAEHLYCGTPADNNRDMIRAGNSCKGRSINVGEDHGMAVLSDAIVYDARRRYADGESTRGIAKSMGISHGTLSHAIHGYTWKHVR